MKTKALCQKLCGKDELGRKAGWLLTCQGCFCEDNPICCLPQSDCQDVQHVQRKMCSAQVHPSPSIRIPWMVLVLKKHIIVKWNCVQVFACTASVSRSITEGRSKLCFTFMKYQTISACEFSLQKVYLHCLVTSILQFAVLEEWRMSKPGSTWVIIKQSLSSANTGPLW